ncbi:UNVERIFIED_CONTAM: hypothetical protein Sangu_3131800, partial [Sesamum angustifolium]
MAKPLYLRHGIKAFIPALTFIATEGENSRGRREPELPDFLQLHGGDHPGMVLVSAPFDGIDFLAWRRSVIIALRAKMKIGFIDGRYVMHEKTSDTYETWIRVDSMILVMDPFPSINNAYSMALRVERERLINMQTTESNEGVALHTKWTENTGNNEVKGGLQYTDRGSHKWKFLTDKKASGVLQLWKGMTYQNACFKIYGGPDWYRNLKDQRQKERGPARGYNVISGEGLSGGEKTTEFGEAMKQVHELLRMMKGQIPQVQQDPLQVNFVPGDDFA